MKLLSNILLLLLDVSIQLATGNKSENTVVHNLWNEKQSRSVSGSDSNLETLYYQVNDSHSFYDALANFTGNSVINVTTNVQLSWTATVVGFTNILITGHNNPTVTCNHHGGLNLVSCYNCTIEGIIWHGCGDNNISNYENNLPAIQLHNSSNITIKNCSFQHSIGQAIVLSGMSGEVNINYCNFLYNNQHKGHGAAIHYSSNITHTYPLKFVIDNCTFSYNEGAKSIVYLGLSSTKLYESFHLHNSSFYHNKGVPVYLTNQTLHVTGSIEICSNTAENGSGIFISDYSNVLIYKNTNIHFINNTADKYGGALYLNNHSRISFKEIPQKTYEKTILVTFYHNQATKDYGGAIYAVNSNVTFGASTAATFNENEAFYKSGGAILIHHSTVIFEGNSAVTFDNNIASKGNCGAVCASNHSMIIFKEYSTVNFTNNRAANGGGGICLYSNSSVMFEVNSTVTFYSNRAVIGGAMFIDGQSTLTVKENSAVSFNDNRAYRCGAVFIDMQSSIIFKGKSTLQFIQNKANYYRSKPDGRGGAVCLHNNSAITFEEDPLVSFNNNRAIIGGAMFTDGQSTLSFKGNSTVTFNDNSANLCGAICIDTQSHINFKGRSKVTFSLNEATINGGALLVEDNSTIAFGGNCKVTFDSNKANNDEAGAMSVKSYSAVTFKGNSTATFIDNSANLCGAICIDTQSYINFKGRSKVTFSLNEATINGGALLVKDNSTIAFGGNCKVTFDSNKANNDEAGAMYIEHYSDVIFEENSAVKFTNNTGKVNGPMSVKSYSAVTFKGSSTVMFIDNNIGTNIYVYENSCITFEGNCKVQFIYSNTALKIHNSLVIFSESSNVTFRDNVNVLPPDTFNSNVPTNGYGGAMYILQHACVRFQGNTAVTFNKNKALNGGAVYARDYSNVTFTENCKVRFFDNKAYYSGGAIFIDEHSSIKFDENSMVMFHENTAVDGYGGAINIIRSSVTFKGNSSVTFDNNTAAVNVDSMGNGGAVSVIIGSRVTFKGNSTVKFVNNRVYYGSGGALCISQVIMDQIIVPNSGKNNKTMTGDIGMYTMTHSVASFEEGASVTFSSNEAVFGGALFAHLYSIVTSGDNSTLTFEDNKATTGGVMHIRKYSIMTFGGNSTTKFNSNKSVYGGTIYINDHSTVTFVGTSAALFSNNIAYSGGGGAMYINQYSNVTFKGNSEVKFCSNEVDGYNGGALYIFDNSLITFMGKCTVFFHGNKASSGGAVYAGHSSTIIFKEISEAIFDNNQADKGGAMYTAHKSVITFNESSTVKYHGNKAFNGGALYAYNVSHITFQGNAFVIFNNNAVTQSGGVLYCYNKCNVLFKQNSEIMFLYNKAQQGGVIYSILDSCINFEGNCTVNFTGNTALGYGGVIHSYTNTVTTFDEYARITFDSNKAKDGGAIYSYSAFIILTEKSENIILFKNNSAEKGGALLIELSNVTFSGDSCINFTNNTALQDGGAIYLNGHSNLVINTEVNFYQNTASDYGGVMYIQMKEISLNVNTSSVYFKNYDTEFTNRSIYINMPKSCNKSCLFKSIKGTNLPVATSPSKLTLYNPAKCIEGNNTECHTYYINNVMLGQEITLDACALDYYDQPITGVTEFLVKGHHQSYTMSGSKFISVLCNHTTQGISVTGNLYSNTSFNYSLVISLHVARVSESKIISVNLTVELGQCHPGFSYFNETQKCKCYNAKNIISCSGSNSTIKSGYWFGKVNGVPTVTSCPNDYCNFTCCEINNGVYHLSPVRANQCTQHRTGIACGNCEQGYTLSFDSSECIPVDKCTIGQMVLVIALSLLYWITVVVAVFVMMYFKIAIGCLYAIIYYYSIVDILLSHNYFISDGVHTTVSIMSSLVKLTPQFLGRLCLVRNMSGIDQQFIHYLHPGVVSLIVFIISVLARRSRRISSFISRGIIHFICFLLLLSYTSVTTTSLLLLRPLIFTDVNTVYTYLSPDIKYLHDRHLAYAIVAIILMIVIVIGLPLLLLLEPFLNSKINFIRIKPLLDQFQGCYKDKYRFFASYYMICRIVIIVLIIARISDAFTTQYLLISVCALMEFIHLMVRPYASLFYNIFDGALLQLIVIIAVLPIVEFVDNYNKTLVIATAYVLIILPFASFIAINLWIRKAKIKHSIKKIQHAIKRLSMKYSLTRKFTYTPLPTDDTDESRSEGDDTIRRNARVVTM